MTTPYVTVDQLRDWMQIPDSQDDTNLTYAVNAATAAIDQFCDRCPPGQSPGSFTPDTSATAKVYRAAQAEGLWLCETHDFYETASLVVQTDSGDNGTFDQTWTATRDYVPLPANSVQGKPYYQIAAVGGRYFPASGIGSGMRHRIQITAKWGWAAVPDDVILACLIKAAQLAKRWQSPESSGGFGASGFAVPLIKINRREDPDVVALLTPYCRYNAIVG